MNVLMLQYEKFNVASEKVSVLSIIAMIEKWRKNMDKRKSCTDLSKAFDCIVHDFLMAKLEAYGFLYEALKVMHNYLTDRKHRTKGNIPLVILLTYCWVSHEGQY